MSTALAIAEARHAQALQDLEAAAHSLEAAITAAGVVRVRRHKIVEAADGSKTHVFSASSLPAKGFEWHHVESAVWSDLYGPLGRVYSTYKRAQRAEAKAERSVHAARRAERDAAVVAVKPRKRAARRVEIGGLDATRVMAGLKELRAA